jgi:hypothetical protein
MDTGSGVVFSEWEIIFTTGDQKRLRLTEVSVQKWKNGKVAKEKFYYKDLYPADPARA